MSGQIQWTVGLVLAGLFAVAIIGFSINYASDNDAAVSISQDDEVSGVYTNLSGTNLIKFKESLENTTGGLLNSSIDSQSGTIESGGTFAGGISDITTGTQNIIRIGYTKIFGANSAFAIFLSIFGAVIGFITLMYFWKTWAGRTPD